jgi:hypothetical protein
MNWKMCTLIVAVTLAITLGGASTAFAQGPTDQPAAQGLRGEVTAVSDEGFTLHTRQGDEVTVIVNDDTRYRMPEINEPSLADVQEGMVAVVRGTLNEDGTFIAQGVGAASREQFRRQLRRHALRGEVTAIDLDSGSLTLSTRRGEWSIQTDENTRYRISDVDDATLADAQVGDEVLVIGKRDEEQQNAGTARLIAVLPQRVTGRGQVTAIEGNVISVDTPQGELTLNTTDDTRYRMADVEDPALDDVQVGDRILFAGQPAESEGDSVTAQLIAVVPEDMVRGRGRVTAIEGNILTVETHRGSYTVVTDESTRFVARHIADPSLDNIEVGNTIWVIGVMQEDDTFMAKGIGIAAPQGEDSRSAQPEDVTVVPQRSPDEVPLP